MFYVMFFALIEDPLSIYFTDPAAQVRRKRVGGFRGQEFSEGCVM